MRAFANVVSTYESAGGAQSLTEGGTWPVAQGQRWQLQRSSHNAYDFEFKSRESLCRLPTASNACLATRRRVGHHLHQLRVLADRA